MLRRLRLILRVLRQTFGLRVLPVFLGLGFLLLRGLLALAMALDPLLFPRLRRVRVRSPIVIVGNPRTGTTFLQRFLCEQGFGAGLQLYRMAYSSLLVQKLLRPLIPRLEALSPARFHKTAAHDTDLSSIETDDASILLRYLDGFFVYGFFLAHAREDLRWMVDPEQRDTSARDFAWMEALWRRSLVFTGQDRVVAKLFSAGARMDAFQARFPDARVLYMARDPLSVIPSAMSLVTGVLDPAFGFWGLPETHRRMYLERLYLALVDLLRRFHADWTSGRIDRSRVLIVRYDRMMEDFDGLMREICAFTGHEPTPAQQQAIARVAEQQRGYRSAHRYDLARFGLDEERIRADTAFFSETFLPGEASESS